MLKRGCGNYTAHLSDFWFSAGCLYSLIKPSVVQVQTPIDSLVRLWHTSPWLVPGMISGGILLCLPFLTTSLVSCICLEPPWIFLALTCFLPTNCGLHNWAHGRGLFHSLRSFRRSRETFLQVKKRKEEEEEGRRGRRKGGRRKAFIFLSYFHFSFIQQILLCAYYVPNFVLRINWGLKGNQETVLSSRIYIQPGRGGKTCKQSNRESHRCQACCLYRDQWGTRKEWRVITKFSVHGFCFSYCPWYLCMI